MGSVQVLAERYWLAKESPKTEVVLYSFLKSINWLCVLVIRAAEFVQMSCGARYNR